MILFFMGLIYGGGKIANAGEEPMSAIGPVRGGYPVRGRAAKSRQKEAKDNLRHRISLKPKN